MIDFEFEIHYKKDSENDDTNVLSQQLNYEKVKITHKKILKENSERILTKSLVITHYIKDVLQDDDDIIRKCHKTRINKHLEIRRTENFI